MGVLAGRQVPGVELAFLAHKNGVALEDLEDCLAIARAESMWYEEAINENEATLDHSYGIWQINMRGDLMLARMREYKLNDPQDLYRAEVNARVMGTLYKRRKWRDWGAFHDGNYLKPFFRTPAIEAVTAYKQRLEESGDRLHLGEPFDCNSLG